MKHLLIDFENIQPQNLDTIPTEETHIWLFLGIVHKNLAIELVQSLLRFGKRAHLVRLQKTGKNALDFYLSYYLGQITATDPQAEVAILSRDGGYDILVEHIATNQHAQSVIRLSTVAEMHYPNQVIDYQQAADLSAKQTAPPAVMTQPILPLFQAALSALRAPNAFRPSRLSNLKLNLQKYVLKDLISEQTIEEKEITVQRIINKFIGYNLIQINESETVSYQLEDKNILLKIQRYILHIKPKTFAEFQAKVKERAEIFCLTVNDSDVQSFARHLREQNLIRQNNGKIEYAPFPEPKKQPEKSQTAKYQPDETIFKKILKRIASTQSNRPNQLNSLKNLIKSHAKCSDQEVEQLFQYLKDKKYIQVNNNKLIYLK